MTKELRVIELFAGVGSQTQALKNIGIPHKVVAISEVDKHALRSYTALHLDNNTNKMEQLNMGDITKIESLPQADLWTYSYPCQDISNAGKGKGLVQGSNTRSSLVWEVGRLLQVAKENGTMPKYLLLENVKALMQEPHCYVHAEWIRFLTSLGYSSTHSILNASDYGIPQNRERIFGVSVLENGEYLTNLVGDIVPNELDWHFPYGKPTRLRIRDILQDESEIDESYYLDMEQIKLIPNSKFIQKQKQIQYIDTLCDTLLCRDYKDPKCVVIGNLENYAQLEMHNRVYSTHGLCPSITACEGGNQEKKILLAGTISGGKWDKKIARLCNVYIEPIVRKLTSKECWRLMGWSDEQIDKVIDCGMSKSQMYKQAGNSVVVQVLEAIFRQLLMPHAVPVSAGQVSMWQGVGK